MAGGVRCSLSPVFLLAAVALASLAGCGGSDLTPAAQEGRAVARDRGCAACHGADGEGGTGPEWTGLAGREVVLADGAVVIADQAYLRRAIVEPDAEIVAGYELRMPPNSLTDEEVTKVLAYIAGLTP